MDLRASTIAPAINVDRTQNVTTDHNLTIKRPANLFVNAAGYDLHLKKKSKAVNAGSPEWAPDVDIKRVPRPWGGGYDNGAYEYHGGEIDPDPGAGTDMAGAEDGSRKASDDSGKDDDEETPTGVKTDSEESPPRVQRNTGHEYGLAGDGVLTPLVVSLVSIGWRLRR